MGHLLVTDHLSDGPLGTSTVIGSLHEPDKGPTLFEGAQSSIRKHGSMHLESLISEELSVSWHRNSNKLSSPTTSEWKPIQRKTGEGKNGSGGCKEDKRRYKLWRNHAPGLNTRCDWDTPHFNTN